MRRLCGLRPTGQLHIGHYFSVIRPALDLECDVLIADYHAPDTDYLTPVRQTLLKFGVPRKQIRVQRDILNARLYFRLLELAKIGELERMTQYKSSTNHTAHLLTYPVLMAHDVADYDEVIVGEDQTQHLEYARKLLKRYNRDYNKPYIIPDANVSGGRIMSLTDPTKKMSKSEPNGCLFLSDVPSVIAHKIKKAVMTEEGRNNLINLYQRLGGDDVIPPQNSDLKELLATQLNEMLYKTLLASINVS